jgi:hypothetical protein
MHTLSVQVFLFLFSFVPCALIAFQICKKKGMPLRKSGVAAGIAGVVIGLALCGFFQFVLLKTPIVQTLMGKKTVEGQLETYGAVARDRLKPMFGRAGVPYPPGKLTMIGLKKEATLELFATDAEGKVHFVTSYPILAASGKEGPKLRSGDYQVPEGFYKIEELQPTTPYHLAMRVNYPNSFDRQHGAKDGRTALGGDIMIHGSDSSAGCLAMGDQTSEDLFVLVSDSGLQNVDVLLLPWDLRTKSAPAITEPKWVPALYSDLTKAVQTFPEPH